MGPAGQKAEPSQQGRQWDAQEGPGVCKQAAAAHYCKTWQFARGALRQQVCPGAPVGGSTFLTNRKMAFSGLTLIRLRITYTNCPTVRSAGTRYLHHRAVPPPAEASTRAAEGAASAALARGIGCAAVGKPACLTGQPANHCSQHPAGAAAKPHFFLSMSGMSLFSAFSTITCSHPTHVPCCWGGAFEA